MEIIYLVKLLDCCYLLVVNCRLSRQALCGSTVHNRASVKPLGEETNGVVLVGSWENGIVRFSMTQMNDRNRRK